MRSSMASAAAALAILAAVLGFGAAGAGARQTLQVKRFLLGRLEPNTGKFLATGGRGETRAFRDSAILLVFSAPVDFESLGSRTVKIGIPTASGLAAPAEGGFFRLYDLKKFDPVSGTYRVQRVYRNRVLFDPTNEQACPMNPGHGFEPFEGFEADTTYSVTVPGTDSGALKTLRAGDGSPLATTFQTTFRTSAEFQAGDHR